MTNTFYQYIILILLLLLLYLLLIVIIMLSNSKKVDSPNHTFLELWGIVSVIWLPALQLKISTITTKTNTCRHTNKKDYMSSVVTNNKALTWVWTLVWGTLKNDLINQLKWLQKWLTLFCIASFIGVVHSFN